MKPHEQPPQMNIKEKVLERISTEQLSMRPKYFFILKAAALITIGVLVLIISIIICDLILFSLRINGHLPLLGFGSRGLWMFFQFFPWGLLLFDAVLVFLLERLLRQFRYGYQTPVLLLFFALAIITFSSGFFIDRATDLNQQLLGKAHEHQLFPPLDEYYDRAGHPRNEEGICRCVVVAIGGEAITAYDESLGTTTLFTVFTPADAHATTTLKVGDVVYIAGDKHEHSIRAFGIQKLDIEPQK